MTERFDFEKDQKYTERLRRFCLVIFYQYFIRFFLLNFEFSWSENKLENLRFVAFDKQVEKGHARDRNNTFLCEGGGGCFEFWCSATATTTAGTFIAEDLEEDLFISSFYAYRNDLPNLKKKTKKWRKIATYLSLFYKCEKTANPKKSHTILKTFLLHTKRVFLTLCFCRYF